MILVKMKNVTPLDVLLTDGDANCSYEVEIRVGGVMHWSGKVEHHDRMNGISDLLRKLADGILTPTQDTPLIKPAAYRNVLDGSVVEEAADEPWLAIGR
jgi:hypothetical protein